jgi:hypothetical protein
MKTIRYGLGGFDPSKINNNIVEEYDVDDPQQPLEGVQIVATLNAVLGIWSLQDAANAVGLSPAELIAEAQAWAVAETMIKS